MKKQLLILTFLFFACNLFAGTYSGGSGTSGDPYQIANLADLQELCQTPADWDKYFLQTDNIDATATQYWDDSDDNTDGDLYNDTNDSQATIGHDEGFSPIGNSTTKFTGTYNGNGHTIDGLKMTRVTDYNALFGYLEGATVENLGVTNLKIKGLGYDGSTSQGFTGGLWGDMRLGSSVNNCYAAGTVTGSGFATGGLGGIINGSSLSNSYAAVAVSGERNVGGLTGSIESATNINTCYATGAVTGTSVNIGGLTGRLVNGGSISNCFARGDVHGQNVVGGLVGLCRQSNSITNSYSTGAPTATAVSQVVGALIGEDENGFGAFTSLFWDKTTSGIATSVYDGTGKLTVGMKSESTFTGAGWDFTGETSNGIMDYWSINSDNDGYPSFTWSSATLSTSAATNITQTSADLGGEITSAGGSEVTERGVVYSVTDNTPTIGETGVFSDPNGTGTGSFSETVSGLLPGTTYYVQAYAINSIVDTSYGGVETFTTLNLTGNALDFDGTDDYVTTGAGLVNFANDMTVEAWFNTTNTTGYNSIATIEKTAGGGVNDYLQILTNSSGNIYLDDANDAPIFITTERYNDGKWHHVAFVRDATAKTIHLYVDGILKGSETYTYSGAIDPDMELRFGNSEFLGGSYQMDGMLDEIRIWDDVRTASEIHDNMCKTLLGDESGLVAYYNFNSLSGTTLSDVTGNGNDGTLNNGPIWVDSEAFTTWTGDVSTSWSEAGNWTDGVPTATDNVGIFGGTNNPVISGSPTVYNFVLGSGGSTTLSSDATINGSLILESNLDLNGRTITLGSTGYLVESAGLLFGGSGSITTTRTLSNIHENVAGLGAEITTSSNMGSTNITRGHTQQTGGITGISRYYEITPANNSGLNASLVFHYDDSELNSITEANMRLLRSIDGGTSWADNGGIVNTTNNTLTLSLIDAFSMWTAGVTSPTLSTLAATSVNSSSALLGGDVTDDGGATISDRGVVYSTTDNTPTIGEAGVTKDANGTGTGSFAETISGLLPGTTYYVQAYAINSSDTSYGGVESFTTENTSPVFTAPTNEYNISDASYSGKSLTAVSGFSTYGVTITKNGTKLYLSGLFDGKVVEYDLSTPYDISTASFVQEKVLSTVVDRFLDVQLKPDGTKLFMAKQYGTIVEYTLSTPYDISTMSLNYTLSVVSGDYGMEFSFDGTKLYVVERDSKTIYQYNLSTAFDLSTASNSGKSFTMGTEASNCMDVAFKTDGTKMLIMSPYDGIWTYNLSTPYDVSTAAYAGATEGFDPGAQEGNAYGMAFNSSGNVFYITGATKKVFQYQINAEVDFAENGTGTVTDVDANDGDGGATDSGITYSLASGGDNDLFNINSTSGLLTFKSAPDYENPDDADTDNVYEVTVTADDGGSSNNISTLAIKVKVTNVLPTASSFSTSSGPTQNQVYTFSTSDFGYSDSGSDPLNLIHITAVPAYGTLYMDANNNDSYDSLEELSNGSTVSITNLDAGDLQYYTTSYSGSTSFTFDVSDGYDYSASTYTATLNVLPESFSGPDSYVTDNSSGSAVISDLNSNLRLWLDATDKSTLYTTSTADSGTSISELEAANSGTDYTGTEIKLWLDKSDHHSNVSQTDVTRFPTYVADGGTTNNNNPTIEFLRTDKDNLNITLPVTDAGNGEQWENDYTVFIVFEQLTDGDIDNAFFSNGNTYTDDNHFQISVSPETGDDFIYKSNHGTEGKYLDFEEEKQNELKLYSVRASSVTGVETLVDGIIKDSNPAYTNVGRKFYAYKINLNRNNNMYNDSRITEVIIYDKMLTDCELDEVNKYLGTKYGKDFSSSFSALFDSNADTDFNNTTVGIGLKEDICGGTEDKRNTATSNGMTLTVADADNTVNRNYIVFSDNNGTNTSNDNAPLSFKRLDKSWMLQEFGNNVLGGKALDFEFDMPSSWNNLEETSFVLLVDDDGDFSNAEILSGGTKNAGKITFNDVVLGISTTLNLSTTAPAYVSLAIKPTPGGVATGLQFWVKAGEGAYKDASNTLAANGDAVLTWSDLSGNSNDASNADSYYQPHLNTSGINFNPALTFNNNDDYLQLSGMTGFPTGANPYTVYTVASNSTTGDYQWVFSYGYNSDKQVVALGRNHDNSTNIAIGHYNSVVISSGNEFAGGTPVVFGATYNGTSSILRKPGISASTTPVSLNVGSNYAYIGRWLDQGNYWNGNIGEIFMYNKNLTGTDLQKVESYMALKYGFSMDQTTPTDYLASDITVIWDATANAGYKTHIFGIGQDDVSGLNQKVSRSVNDGNGPILATTQNFTASNSDGSRTELGNGNFMVMSHNNGTENSFTSSFNGGTNNRSDRVYKVAETGIVGDVYFAIPYSAATFPSGGSPALVISGDETFDNTDATVPLTYDRTNGLYWAQIDPADGDYIALATSEISVAQPAYYRTSSTTTFAEITKYSSYADFIAGTNGAYTTFDVKWSLGASFFSDGIYFYQTNNVIDQITRYPSVEDMGVNTNGVTFNLSQTWNFADEFFASGNQFFKTTSSATGTTTGTTIGVTAYPSFADLVANTNGDYTPFVTTFNFADQFFHDGEYFLRTNTEGSQHVSVARYASLNDLANNVAFDTQDFGPYSSNDDIFTVGITPVFKVSEKTLTVGENTGVGTFTVVLNTQPTSDVVIDVSSDDTNEATVDKPTLTFTTANWNTPQEVTVTGVDDNVFRKDTATITVSVNDASSDNTFDVLEDQTVGITLTDDEEAPEISVSTSALPPITYCSFEGSEPISFDVSATYLTEDLDVHVPFGFEISLNSSSEFKGDISLTPSSGTVSNTTIYVRVATGVTGELPSAITLSSGAVNETVTISAANNNALYFDGTDDYVSLSGNTIADGAVNFTFETWILPDNSNWDGDHHAIIGRQNGDFSLKQRNPSFYIIDGKIHVDMYEDVTLERFNITTDNAVVLQDVWTHLALVKENTEYRFYVNGQLILTRSAPGKVNIVGAYNIGFVDNYFAGKIDDVRFWSTARTQTEIENSMNLALNGDETGLVGYYTFNRGTAEGNNLGVTTLIDNSTSGINGTLNNMVLTGSSSNWVDGYFAQITGKDTVNKAETLELSHAQIGGVWSSDNTGIATVNQSGQVTGVSGGSVNINYELCGKSTFKSITVKDDAAYTVNKTTLTVDEDAGTNTFTVVLDVAPTSNVVFDVSSDDTNEATVDKATLTFTTENWDTIQTVTITGVDDDIDRDDNVTITIAVKDASSANAFDALADQTVAVTLTDDDIAGFTVSETALTVDENGGTSSFDVVLNSEPTSNVVIDVLSDDDNEATVSASSLIFTSENWDTPQTVTVTGVDDDIDSNDAAEITVAVNGAFSDDTFDALEDQTVVVTLTNDDQTITFNELPGKTYGDADFNLSATSSSGLGVTYSSSNTNVATVSGSTVTIVGAGSCTIYADQSGDDTYDAAPQVSQVLTVNKKPITVTADAGQTKVYGESDPTFTYTTSATLESGDSFTGSLSRDAGENVGHYALTIGTLSAGTNYALTFVSKDFSITKKPVTVTADAGQTKGYGETDPTFTYTTSTSLESGDSFTGSLSRVAGENVGNYAIAIGTLSAGTNYDLTFVSKDFSITKKPVTVTADAGQAKVYGQTDPAFTYTTSTTLESGDSFTGSLSRVAGEDVGNYAIAIGTLSAGTNYDLTFVSNDFEITKKAMTVTADDKTKEYDGTAFSSFTVSYNGFVNGEDKDDLSGILVFSGTATTATSAGTGYVITPGGLTSLNYDITFIDGKLDITPKAQTITFNTLPTKVYGDVPFNLTGTSSSGLAVTYTSSNTSVATISGSTVTIVGAGSTTIIASQSGNTNYSAATDVEQELLVDKANQVLTLNALPVGELPLKDFTDPIQVTASSSSGLPVVISLGEGSVATLNGSNQLESIGKTGNVIINVDQAGNDNYNSATIQYTFDVVKSNQSITFPAIAAQTYSPGLTLDIDGAAKASSNLDVSYSVASGPGTIAGTTLSVTGAGTILIKASQAGNAEYNPATDVTQTITIEKATPVIVNFDNIEKIYGDVPFVLNATSESNGLFTYNSSNTDVAIIEGNTVIIVGTGETTLTASQDFDDNYTTGTTTATLTVNKADQTISFDPLDTKTDKDADFQATAISTSGLPVTFTSSDESVAICSGTNGSIISITGIGSCIIYANQEGNSNFNAAPSVEQTLTVVKYIAGDTNLDGQITPPEIAGDTNGDGQIGDDEIAGDTDGDGTITAPEVAGDTNGDGQIGDDEIAGDTDGDGTITAPEVAGDTNGDGQIGDDEIAGDTDGDGTITAPEVAGDTNGDSQIGDGEVAGDTDGDGTITAPEVAGDTNGDGQIGDDEIAGDTDGNGTITAPEVAGDTNGDGQIGDDEIAGDTDGDGTITAPEVAGDTNGDGQIGDDEIAGDTDGDGTITAPEIAGDTNGDGQIGDDEIAGDTDGDGTVTAPEVAGDTNGDGQIGDDEIAGDTDGDGTITAPEVAGDTNGDGQIGDDEIAGDTNGDGTISDGEMAGDTNGDGQIGDDETAGDTDGDGTITAPEIAGDTNGDGQITSPEIIGDTDGNGIINDDEVTGDRNGDGNIGSGETAGESETGGSNIAGDTNGDGQIGDDEIAGDTNGDGTITAPEIAGDTNGDGQIGDDEIAGDTNGDGTITAPEVAGDTNGDGQIGDDEIAGDTDGDGTINDGEEVGDTNGDGEIGNGEVAGDTNGDGQVNNDEIPIGTFANITVLTIDGVSISEPDDDIYYLIDCDDTRDYIAMSFELEYKATSTHMASFEIEVPAPGIYSEDISVVSADSSKTRTYHIVVEKRFNFDDIVIQKYNNVLLINNNPETNGGYHFTEFNWYRDGQLIGTGQYYSAGNNTSDQLDLDAEYSVELVTDDGDVLRTCDFTVAYNIFSLNVAPNPVKSGSTIDVTTTYTPGMLADMQITIHNLSGAKVMQEISKSNNSRITLPTSLTPGTYVVTTRAGGVELSTKIVVQ